MMRVLVACEQSGVVRPIEGFPAYLVCADGYVLSKNHRWGAPGQYKKLVGREDAKGYLSVTLCAGPAIRRSFRIHRLVAEAFHPNNGRLPCVRHLDGNPKNNAAYNLAWGTYAENEADKVLHGTNVYAPAAKLSSSDRAWAFQQRRDGATCAEIAASLNVSRPTISRLLSGATWGKQP